MIMIYLVRASDEAEKKGATARDRCSTLWHCISHCVIYTVLAFFAAIVVYYIIMRAGAQPALLPGAGK